MKGINRVGTWPRHESSRRGTGQLKVSASVVMKVAHEATKQLGKVGKRLGRGARASAEQQFTGRTGDRAQPVPLRAPGHAVPLAMG